MSLAEVGFSEVCGARVRVARGRCAGARVAGPQRRGAAPAQRGLGLDTRYSTGGWCRA
jgi:hypothetical protein